MLRKGLTENRRVVGIDFFCGCGGVTNGMMRVGIDVLAGFDNDPRVQYAFEENNNPAKFVLSDIEERKGTVEKINEVLKEEPRDILIFMACAPCQPFSLHNRKYVGDVRKSLMLRFIDVVSDLKPRNKPDVIFVENVGSMKKRGREILDEVKQRLHDLKYEILDPTILNASEFGVPQNRKRLITIAIKKNLLVSKEIKFNWQYFKVAYRSNLIDVRRAIGKLPPIPHNHKLNKIDPLHITRELGPINLQRIRQITKPGGNRAMWDKKYLLACYIDHDGHKDVYGRMHWDKPAPTLTCKCTSISNGRFGHPEQDRAISLREAAILQTLDGYKFKEPIQFVEISRQIGNAVPPKFVEKIAQFILELV